MASNPIDDRDVDIVARTIYGEARGEFLTGIQAVANVIMNRAHIARDYVAKHNASHPLFGDGRPMSACLAKYQFSCWNSNDPNCEIIKEVTESDNIFARCVETAKEAVGGTLEDRTKGATHYFDRRAAHPEWAEGKSPCVTIGHHLFFNNID